MVPHDIQPRLTIVLLPGMDGTGLLFDAIEHELHADLDVMVLGYPSHTPLGYPELEAMVLDALPRNKPYIVLGESFSGPLAISLAAAALPGLVGLILCCTFVKNPRPEFSLFKPFAGMVPFGLTPLQVMSFLLLGGFANKELRRDLGLSLSIVSSSVMRARLRAILAVDASEKLKRVSVPVMYLRATKDRLIPRSASALVTALCPSAQFVDVVGPHLLLQAATRASAEAIVAFAQRVAHGERPDDV